MTHSTSRFPTIFKNVSRRTLFKGTGLMALAGIFGCGKEIGQSEPEPKSAHRIPLVTYESISIKPVINLSGTMTHLGLNVLELS